MVDDKDSSPDRVLDMPSKRNVLSSLDAARLHVSRDSALDNEKNETANAAGDTSTLAGQLLSALQLSQDATLQFVSAWFDGAAEVVAKLTDMAATNSMSCGPPAARWSGWMLRRPPAKATRWCPLGRISIQAVSICMTWP